MTRRSLQASPQGIQDIKKALKRKKWSQTYIAGAVGCSRQTIWSLLQGNLTDCEVFMEVCTLLGLNWQEIAESELPQNESQDIDIDALVQEVRESLKPDIQERCGTMRVLDMTQPIALGDIYTHVNILEKITSRRGFERSELTMEGSPEMFERFSLGKIREHRIPGLEVVEKFSKLMILGKPGAGKTTFLKHLAVGCIGGEFQGEKVPVFVTLKDFAEAEGKPDLLEYITLLVAIPFVGAHGPGALVRTPLQPNVVAIQEILLQGRALILLDGLDEVREADNSHVLKQIRDFSHNFHLNQFIITCRIAAKEYTFEKFTEVEVADFNDEQIADFSDKWFRSKNDPIKAERFLQRLQEDAPIRELATSPLLLTLLCLVFEDTGSFPTNRAELYQTGVDVLLKKWDVKRNIEREQVYKRLSLKRKEDLLSQIARITFEAGNYFFKQWEIERYITQYIQNLPEASTDPEVLELDSMAVLKSIEAQHGLFVERARGIYSFSHLTFHEYFAARKIVNSCNPYAVDDPTLQMLVSHVTEKRWREVFLLTVGMLDSADVLLRLMKVQIDELLMGDERLQEFLRWVDEKAQSVEAPYKLSAVRAFYFDDCGRRLSLSEKIDNTFYKYLGKIPLLCLVGSLRIDFDFYKALNSSYWLDKALEEDSEGNPDQNQGLYHASDGLFSISSIDLKNLHQNFKFSIGEINRYNPHAQWKEFKNWWQANGETWTEQLKSVMIEHRNIGHDWQFNEEQKQLLQQYYDANILLVDCLNSDCYISREVRQEIEETLLLPIAQIKN